MNYPNMLLVGSTARNTGKTTFCLAFLEKWGKSFDIVAVKVSTVAKEGALCHHGDFGCGACSSFSGKYEISVETDPTGKKDTNLLLNAGASKVFWIRTLKSSALEAFESIMGKLPESSIILCESNVLFEFITPGLAVLMHRSGIENVKQSSELFREKADFICDISQPHAIEDVLRNVNVSQNGIIYRALTGGVCTPTDFGPRYDSPPVEAGDL